VQEGVLLGDFIVLLDEFSIQVGDESETWMGVIRRNSYSEHKVFCCWSSLLVTVCPLKKSNFQIGIFMSVASTLTPCVIDQWLIL